MVCHGGFSLDEATRRTWYNPEEIISFSGLMEGMTFADIGSGEGFFSILAATVVGPKGRVYAVDIDQEAVGRLRRKAVELNLLNVQAFVGEAESAILCSDCADVVFYSMVLHDFHNPVRVLQNARTMLKQSGKVVNLDWKKKKTPFGPPEQIRFTEEIASDLMKKAALNIVEVKDVGPYHYIVTAKK